MSKIKNRNVLVTGGASGLGKLLGTQCLEKGARSLVIWDVNEDVLYKTAGELQAQGYEIHPYLVDVTDTAAVEAAAEDVIDKLGTIDLLFNNAGIVVGKDFEDHTAKDIDLTMHINVTACMHVTRVFLPEMIRRERGHIINIASAAGLIPNPKMSVYVASKWAVIGWSESLRIELEKAYHNMHVTTVMPGFIDTGMFEGVKSPMLMPMLKPKDIVNKIIKAVRYNDVFVQEPWIVKFTPMLRGILPPRLFDFIAGDLLKVYDSMNQFVGHSNKESKSHKEK